MGHLGAATSGWTGGCFPPGALPDAPQGVRDGPGSLLLRRIGPISGGLLPLGGSLCVSVQTITVWRALRELRPRRPMGLSPCPTCPSLSPTTRFSYHTNRRCHIRCHKVVAVPPQGSKGRPAHAVASSEPWTNNMTRIQELLAASVNNGLKLSQQLCRCPAILSVQMGS